MSASLQKLLTEQPPTSSGIHEAVAQHSEAIFKEFQGILPLFLGKRRTGSFINVTLPNAVTQSSEALLQTISDFIWVYDLRVISFVSAIRMQNEKTEENELQAMLITADSAHAYFQLPWQMEFDSENDIKSFKRIESGSDIIPREIWSQIFSTKAQPDTKTFSFDRLIERFGDVNELPQP